MCGAGFSLESRLQPSITGSRLGWSLSLPIFWGWRVRRWQELFFSRQLALGLFMIPIGFITGNSYGVLRYWNRFRTDFLFNYIVTPRYEGQPDRVGYLSFLQRIPEIIGRPGVAAILVCIFIAAIVVLRKRDLSDNATRGFILASTLFLFYFLKMGAFPRQPTRFVLPAIPFLLLAIGPAFQKGALRNWLCVLLAPVLIYNCICSYFVGQRFNDDPVYRPNSGFYNT